MALPVCSFILVLGACTCVPVHQTDDYEGKVNEESMQHLTVACQEISFWRVKSSGVNQSEIRKDKPDPNVKKLRQVKLFPV